MVYTMNSSLSYPISKWGGSMSIVLDFGSRPTCVGEISVYAVER